MVNRDLCRQEIRLQRPALPSAKHYVRPAWLIRGIYWLTLVVQEANWYKPEPGELHRPLVAMPSQLKQRVPWLSFCEDFFFTEYDPPTTLKSATACSPVITPGSDPKTQALAAVPSLTIDPVARTTAAAKSSISVPIIEASQTRFDLD